MTPFDASFPSHHSHSQPHEKHLNNKHNIKEQNNPHFFSLFENENSFGFTGGFVDAFGRTDVS